MEIQGVTGDLDPVKAQRSQRLRRNPVEPASAPDTVEISREAQEKADVQRVREVADKLPEIRDERVTQARDRVQSGYYDREDVKNAIVDQLLNNSD